MAIRKRGGGEGVAPKSSKLRRRLRTGPDKAKFNLKGTEVEDIIRTTSKALGPNVLTVGTNVKAPPRVRTGVLSLDIGLGGGFMVSRASMLYGEKSTGKSTLAMRTAANMQKLYPDMAVAWNDIEHTFDGKWFEKNGGDLSRLILAEPETGEHAVDIADALMRSKEISMVVTDSIAMLVPMKELAGSAEDSLPGVHARLVGNYIRRTTNAILKERHRGHNPLLLHINQFRMKIGIAFGDPRTLPGGKALEFSTSQQVETRNKEHKYDKGDFKGQVKFNEHTCVITKNKTGGRLKDVSFKLIRHENEGYPEGTIDQIKSVIAWGSRYGEVTGRATFPAVDKKFNSADEAGKWFLDHPEDYDFVQRRIIDAVRRDWDIA